MKSGDVGPERKTKGKERRMFSSHRSFRKSDSVDTAIREFPCDNTIPNHCHNLPANCIDFYCVIYYCIVTSRHGPTKTGRKLQKVTRGPLFCFFVTLSVGAILQYGPRRYTGSSKESIFQASGSVRINITSPLPLRGSSGQSSDTSANPPAKR